MKKGKIPQINETHPDGNRHTRRKKVAQDRQAPYKNKMFKLFLTKDKEKQLRAKGIRDRIEKNRINKEKRLKK